MKDDDEARDDGRAPSQSRSQSSGQPGGRPGSQTYDWAPGMMVRHPQRPDWGLGQVQSAIGTRVTVNFENAGKLLIDVSHAELVPAEPD